MAMRCTICMHEQRTAIDKALIRGETYRRLAARFSVSKNALQRHRKAHLAEALARAQSAQAMAEGLARAQHEEEVEQAKDVMKELLASVRRVRLLYDACDRWLRDPDDPSRYDICPRAEDIEVTYTRRIGKGKNAKVVKRKARLSELLAEAGIGIESGLDFGLVDTKHVDPRELLLKTFDRIKAHLELVAELEGRLNRTPQVNLVQSPEWIHLRGVILVALEPFPEARQEMVQALAKAEACTEALAKAKNSTDALARANAYTEALTKANASTDDLTEANAYAAALTTVQAYKEALTSVEPGALTAQTTRRRPDLDTPSSPCRES